MDAAEIETAAAALRHVDVAHRLERHARDEHERLAFRLDESQHPDLVGNVMRARAWRKGEEQGEEEETGKDGDASQAHPVLQISAYTGRHFRGRGQWAIARSSSDSSPFSSCSPARRPCLKSRRTRASW